MTSADDTMVDIAIGGSGSEVIVIPDIQVFARRGQDKAGPFKFPISIPAGTRVSARCSNVNGVTGNTYVKLTFLTPSALFPCTGGYVDGYGTITNGKGVNVDPGGVANTKSAWVEIAASTNRAHQWLMMAVSAGDFAIALGHRWLIDVGIGGAGSEVVLIPDLLAGAADIYDGIAGGPWEFPIYIPQGSRLTVRAQDSQTTDNDRDLYIRMYGC